MVEQRTFNPLVAGSNPARPTTHHHSLLQKAELVQKSRGVCPKLLSEIDYRTNWEKNSKWFWWCGDPVVSDFFSGALRSGYPPVLVANVLVERLWINATIWDELVEDRDTMEFVLAKAFASMEALLGPAAGPGAYKADNIQVLNAFYRMSFLALEALDKKKRRPRARKAVAQ